jgi:hypothetical protein
VTVSATVAQPCDSDNVFACLTPVEWPATRQDLPDPSGQTCIVSLVNEYKRPFRLRLQNGAHPDGVVCRTIDGVSFGSHDGFVGLNFSSISGECCRMHFELAPNFQLDAEAEKLAGLPVLPFSLDVSLLSGLPLPTSGRQLQFSFKLGEVECYAIDD